MEYWPEVIQVIPTEEYKVYVYFDNGKIKLYDATELVRKGVFKPLQDKSLFIKSCTVLNHTLAWTPDLSYDPSTCLDIDPFSIYETCKDVEELDELFVK